MATYSKSKVALVVTLGLMPVVLIAFFVVNTFVYPFRSATPNFGDVEAVYNKLQIPSDWQVIEESENRGIAGRQCPVESDGCFSKGARFSVPTNTSRDIIVGVLLSSGCISPIYRERENTEGEKSASYECAAGSVKLSGSLIMQGAGWEASLYAGSE